MCRAVGQSACPQSKNAPPPLTQVWKGKSLNLQWSRRPCWFAFMPLQMVAETSGVEHLRGPKLSNSETGTGFLTHSSICSVETIQTGYSTLRDSRLDEAYSHTVLLVLCPVKESVDHVDGPLGCIGGGRDLLFTPSQRHDFPRC